MQVYWLQSYDLDTLNYNCVRITNTVKRTNEMAKQLTSNFMRS